MIIIFIVCNFNIWLIAIGSGEEAGKARNGFSLTLHIWLCKMRVRMYGFDVVYGAHATAASARIGIIFDFIVIHIWCQFLLTQIKSCCLHCWFIHLYHSCKWRKNISNGDDDSKNPPQTWVCGFSNSICKHVINLFSNWQIILSFCAHILHRFHLKITIRKSIYLNDKQTTLTFQQ